MPSLLAVLALEDARVHICISDSGDIAFYIEPLVNQFFCFTTTLDILDVHNNGHI